MHNNKTYRLSEQDKKVIDIFEKPYSTKTQALQEAGISLAQYNKLMQNPSFRAYLNKRRNVAFEEELERLKPLFGKALDVVTNVLSNSSSDMLKLRAASMIMDLTIQWRKDHEMEEKIKTLERKMGIHNDIVIDIESDPNKAINESN